MVKSTRNAIVRTVEDIQLLLNNIPSAAMALFVVSVVLMNILAGKEINTGISWLALDCGLCVSWLSFLCMDMLTKRFGAKATIKLTIIAILINLLVCLIFLLVSLIPGNWSAFYDFNLMEVNQALNQTFGGTWYILLGSTIAFFCSSVVNAIINSSIGKKLNSDTFGSYAIRCYVSTLFGQFVDNFIFSIIVSHTFFGWTMVQCITCSITGCVVELLCEIVFSPIGYKVCKQWEEDEVGSQYIRYVQEEVR